MTENSLATAAFRVIHIRSLIAEALLSAAAENISTELMTDIRNAAFKTADNIEHIAEDGFNKKLSSAVLIQSLETALFIMDSFRITLNKSRLNLPAEKEICALIESLKLSTTLPENEIGK